MRLWLTPGKVALLQSEAQSRHISTELVSDRRWKRPDIKSTWLLAQVLAKQHASTSGADEAIMREDAVLARMARCVRIRSVHPYCLALPDTFFWISRAHSIPVSERPISIDELDALSKTVRYRRDLLRYSHGPPWRQAGWRWGGQARRPSCCKHPTSSAHAILATGQHFGTASARPTESAWQRHIADAASRRPREGICVSEQPASSLRSIQLQPAI